VQYRVRELVEFSAMLNSGAKVSECSAVTGEVLIRMSEQRTDIRSISAYRQSDKNCSVHQCVSKYYNLFHPRISYILQITISIN
jgi:hypothetical protein